MSQPTYFKLNDQEISLSTRFVKDLVLKKPCVYWAEVWSRKRRKQLLKLLAEQLKCQPIVVAFHGTDRGFLDTLKAAVSEHEDEPVVLLNLDSYFSPETLYRLLVTERESLQRVVCGPLMVFVQADFFRQFETLPKDDPQLHLTTNLEQYQSFLQETTDAAFDHVLNTSRTWSQDHAGFIPNVDADAYHELNSALEEIQHHEVELSDGLMAATHFTLARETNFSTPPCRIHFEKSLQYARRLPANERIGGTLFYLGLGWMLHGARTFWDENRCYQFAAEYFAESLDIFDELNRADLVAKYIGFYAGVLARLQRWDVLRVLLERAESLLETYPDKVVEARVLGYKAELEIAEGEPDTASGMALHALAVIKAVPFENSEELSSINQVVSINKILSYHRGYYLYMLAQARERMRAYERSVEFLQVAAAEVTPKADPSLYLKMLKGLEDGFYRLGAYRKAFAYRLDIQALEGMFGASIFVGAAQLQPEQQMLHLAPLPFEFSESVAPEIEITGRLQLLHQILDRLECEHGHFVVLSGRSGSGKSSLIHAGLHPLLQRDGFNGHQVRYFSFETYKDWPALWCDQIADEDPGERPLELVLQALDLMLRKGEKVVIVLDQLEEFFFSVEYVKTPDRLPKFLAQVASMGEVYLIVSIRERYRQRLQQWRPFFEHKPELAVALDDEHCFRVPFLSLNGARRLIERGIERTKLQWEPQLIDTFLSDLAGEFDDIHPIELQVVGARLQNEGVQTVADYRQKGPKARFAERWLEDICARCGKENEMLVLLVLNALATNETDFSRTFNELESYLSDSLTVWRIEDRRHFYTVLDILRMSGVIRFYPELPANRYKLAYTYLAPRIRERFRIEN